MKLNFRQGIVKARLLGGIPDFLQQNQNNPAININITTTPLVVSATFGDSNYLIQESVSVVNAWGPILWNNAWGQQPLNVTYHLYWDINLGTGAISRNFTPWTPITSSIIPLNPNINQHWYDLNTFSMKVWNGSFWEIKSRVFACSWAPGVQLIVPNQLGTQVGITSISDNIAAGFILLGNDLKGIKTSDGRLLTSESDIIINQGNYTSPVQLEVLSTQATAVEPIPAYFCVTIVGPDQIGLAIAGDISKLSIGIVVQDLAPGDTGKFIHSGIVFNQNWSWDITLGKMLYVGRSGEITQLTPGAGVTSQQIATIISPTSIFVIPGVSGIVGPMGQTGPIGPIGLIGPTGVTGPAGVTGPIGLIGPTGVNGIVGPTGLQADMTRLYPYDLSFFYPGALTHASIVIGSIVVLREIDILVGAPTSLAKSLVAAAAATTINISINNLVVGNVFFNAGSTTGIITMPAAVLLAGDIISIVSPSVLDITLANVMVTITGYSRSIPL